MSITRFECGECRKFLIKKKTKVVEKQTTRSVKVVTTVTYVCRNKCELDEVVKWNLEKAL